MLLASCDNLNQSNSTVLENGNVVSTEEQEFLESLEPDFVNLVNQFEIDAYSRGLNQTTEEYNLELIQVIEEFMQETIGADYDQYLIQGELDGIDVNGNPVSRVCIYIDEDDDISTIEQTVQNRGYLELQLNGVYYLQFYSRYVRLPWGSWSWAGCFISDMAANPIGGGMMSATEYQDEVTPLRSDSNIWNDSNNNGIPDRHELVSTYTEASGNMKYGWFPKISNIRSEHWLVHQIIGNASHGNQSNDFRGTFDEYGWHSGRISWIMP